MSNYVCEVEAGTRWAVRCQGVYCGEDFAVTVTGGEREHLGAVSLGVYSPEKNDASVSTATITGHRDDRISADWAARLSVALGVNVCVAAGIHVDDAASSDIERLLDNSEKCCGELLKQLAAERAEQL